MCSTTLMEASPSDELPRPPHFLLNNNNNITKVVAMSPASPDDSVASGEDRAAPCSPCSPGAAGSPARCGDRLEDDDDEISVGCPSPSPHAPRDGLDGDVRMSDDEDYRRYRSGSSSPVPRQEEDYFKPLKKLKMMQINKQARKLRRQSSASPAPPPPAPYESPEHQTATGGTSPSGPGGPGGVKSFSIMDILNHRPRPAHSPVRSPLPASPPASLHCPPSALHRVDAAHAVGLMLQSPAMLAAAAASRIVRPWDFGGMLDPAIMMERLHQQQQTLRRHQQHVQHVQQQHLHLQQQAAAHHQAQQALSLSRPQSADLSSSACSSGRSSTASDCCSPSPDVRRQQQQQQQGKDGNSPLDALFQMTSKTFDGLNGEQSAGEPRRAVAGVAGGGTTLRLTHRGGRG
ncbi:hypothetical protein ONE63_010066 [Megalurothrips usitatus]|uniref:Uncharacterized protein n=1 Tax=Megalurothrips usitatus TaxID=439358 RepID=A0AAV7XN74_9NEOP|nr:hypothetical protein ONE63_010066 [Megalurothrips usitatus]